MKQVTGWLLLSGACLAAAVSPVAAQTTPTPGARTLQVAFGPAYMHRSGGDGDGAETVGFIVDVAKGIGKKTQIIAHIVGDFSATFGSGGANVMYHGGLRIGQRNGRVRIFGQFMYGHARLQDPDGPLSPTCGQLGGTCTGSRFSDSGFSLQTSVGVNVDLGSGRTIRIQGDVPYIKADDFLHYTRLWVGLQIPIRIN